MTLAAQILSSLALVLLAGVALLPGRRPPRKRRRHEPRISRYQPGTLDT